MTNMRNWEELFGMKKGKLTVLGIVAIQGTFKSPALWKWACKCECGAIITRQAASLANERNDRPCCLNCKAPYGTKPRNNTGWLTR